MRSVSIGFGQSWPWYILKRWGGFAGIFFGCLGVVWVLVLIWFGCLGIYALILVLFGCWYCLAEG